MSSVFILSRYLCVLLDYTLFSIGNKYNWILHVSVCMYVSTSKRRCHKKDHWGFSVFCEDLGFISGILHSFLCVIDLYSYLFSHCNSLTVNIQLWIGYRFIEETNLNPQVESHRNISCAVHVYTFYIMTSVWRHVIIKIVWMEWVEVMNPNKNFMSGCSVHWKWWSNSWKYELR